MNILFVWFLAVFVCGMVSRVKPAPIPVIVIAGFATVFFWFAG